MTSEDSTKPVETVPPEAMRPIRTIYIAPHDFPLIAALLKKAKREGWSFSEMVLQALRFYALRHSKDNDQFRLDPWNKDPGLLALPTLGEIPREEYFEKLSEADVLLLAKKIRGWKAAIHPKIRELDYKWDW